MRDHVENQITGSISLASLHFVSGSGFVNTTFETSEENKQIYYVYPVLQ
jgi:hypothetical protein